MKKLIPALIVLFAFGARAQQPELPVNCAQDPQGISPQPLVYGSYTVGCAISPATDQDIFSFVGAPGDHVRIIVRSASPGFDPRIEVIDPGFAFIHDGFCSGSAGLAATFCTNLVDLTLTTQGTHIVRVSDDGMNETGNFTLQLERLPPVFPGLELTYGAAMTVTGQLAPVTDHDFFRFDAVSGSSILFVVQSQTSGLDPRVEITDPQGMVVFDGFCSGSAGLAAFQCQLSIPLAITATGTYRATLSDSGSDESGSYAITLLCQSFNCPATQPLLYPGSGEDLVMATAAPVSSGALTTGPGADVKAVSANDQVLVHWSTPEATFADFPHLLVGQLFTTGTPAPSAPGFPSVHLNPFSGAPVFLLFDGNAGPLGKQHLQPAGVTLGLVIPSGLVGTSLMLQALSLSGGADNGIFAITDGYVFQIVP